MTPSHPWMEGKIKITYCLCRKAGMSREAFQTDWRTVHAPLVARHAKTLGIVRYVQKHALPDEAAEALRTSRDAPRGFDGVAEIGFESLRHIESAAIDPVSRRPYGSCSATRGNSSTWPTPRLAYVRMWL